MTKDVGVLEKERGGLKKDSQLSTRAIQGKIRAASPEMIKRLIELTQSRNPSISLGAIKLALNKIVPDLKSVEATTTEDKNPVPFVISFQNDVATTDLSDDEIKRKIAELGQELEKREQEAV